MAITNGWGQATQNNTNGFGKYQNTIDAGSVYADSYAGETVIEGTSAAFSYPASSYHQDQSDPTPTITGTAGGTFSATPSGLSINTSTGTIDLDNSTIQSYTITYTVSGVSANFSLSVTASPFLANTYSMEFDGVNDYIDLGTDSSLDIFGSDFSVSLWFKHSNSSGSARAMIEIGASSYTGKMAITLGFTSNTGVGFAVGSNWYTNAGSGFNDGNWHHMVATRTGTTYKIYIDSQEITASAPSGSYSYTNANSIGKGNFGGNFAGKLDEIAFWNTVLGETAIQEIYNATNNNTGKALDLTQDSGNYNASSNLQYFNRLGD